MIHNKPQYVCVCGKLFEHHQARTMHFAECETMKDHELANEILNEFPRDKYGGYLFIAPAALTQAFRARLIVPTVSEEK